VTGKLSSGTLLYMSPEQLHGAAPTPAQDVYSFAAMAYECLTGHPPFSRGQIEWQIVHAHPSPLPDVIAIAEGILRGLAKEVKRRPLTCSDMLSNCSLPFPEAQLRIRKGKRTRCLWGWSALVFLMILVVLGLCAFYLLWRTAEVPCLVAHENISTTPQRLDNGELNIVPEASKLVIVTQTVERVERKVETEDDRRNLRFKDEADADRKSATAYMTACREINDEDGFSARKQSCETSFVSANAAYDRADWKEARNLYSEVALSCKALQRLDADRLKARVAFDAAGESARLAREQKAASFASGNFQEATASLRKGREAFAAMRFAEATKEFGQAQKHFADSAETARTARCALEEKVRKESEEKRLADEREKSLRLEREREIRKYSGRWSIQPQRNWIISVNGNKHEYDMRKEGWRTVSVSPNGRYEITDYSPFGNTVRRGKWRKDGDRLVVTQDGGRTSTYSLRWRNPDECVVVLEDLEAVEQATLSELRQQNDKVCGVKMWYDDEGNFHKRVTYRMTSIFGTKSNVDGEYIDGPTIYRRVSR